MGALEVVAGALVVALVLWPVTAHPGGPLAGMLDAPYHAWLGWRIAELWRSGHLLTSTIPDAFAPMGFDLRLIDGLAPAWVTAAWNLLTGGRLVLSYNLALATGVALDLWAGRALGRVLSSRRWIWLACGVAFATAPALLGSVQAHIAFVYAFALPLLLREAVLVARGDTPGRWVRIASYLAIAYLCSAYHLVFGSIMFVVVLVAWPRSAVWSRVVLVRLAGAACIALAVLSPFIVARVTYERDERAAGSTDVVRSLEATAFSADALGAITPPDSLWLTLPVPRADLGVQLYAPLRPAFVGYALAVGLAGVCFVRRPARRALLVTAAVLWTLSLGPVLHLAGTVIGSGAAAGSGTAGGLGDVGSWWMPYRWLQAVPGLGALRAPTRAGYAIAAVAAAALAVSLDALLDRLSHATPAPAPIAGGVSGEMVSDAGAAGTGDGDVDGARTGGVADDRLARASMGAAAGAAGDAAGGGPAVRSRLPSPWIGAGVAGAVGVLLACSLTLPVPTTDLAVSDQSMAGLRRMASESEDAPDNTEGVLIVPWGCRLDDPRIIALQSIHHRPNIGCNPPPTATRWFSGLDVWARSAELAALRCDQSHIDQRPVPFDGSARLGGADGVARLRRDLGVRYVVIDRGTLPPFGCESVRDALATLATYRVVSDDGQWQILDLDAPAAAAP